MTSQSEARFIKACPKERPKVQDPEQGEVVLRIFKDRIYRIQMATEIVGKCFCGRVRKPSYFWMDSCIAEGFAPGYAESFHATFAHGYIFSRVCWQRQLVAVIRPCHYVQHQRRIAHRTCNWADV